MSNEYYRPLYSRIFYSPNYRGIRLLEYYVNSVTKMLVFLNINYRRVKIAFILLNK